jgi:signal peptidase I
MVRKKLIRNYLESLFWAVALALVLREWVVTPYRIPSGAMQPTLLTGDHVFSWRPPYGFRFPFREGKLVEGRTPERGDIVVFRYGDDQESRFIKRVVAVGGDKVEIRGHELKINDVPAQYSPNSAAVPGYEPGELYGILTESILGSERAIVVRRDAESAAFGPVLVPAGHFFVLGDNRDGSDDSRDWGMVADERIEGRVFAIWFSRDPVGRAAIRWERVFSWVR